MRTPSVLGACAALGLVLLLSVSAPCAVASRPQNQAATATPSTATEQAHETARGPQPKETTEPQGLAAAVASWIRSAQLNLKSASDGTREEPGSSSPEGTPARFGRGPALLPASGTGATAGATSAAAMASRAEKLRAWWRESAEAWGSCLGGLRRRFQGGSRADVSAAKDDVSQEAWQVFSGELEDAVLGAPEHGEPFHQVKVATTPFEDAPQNNKRRPATTRGRWSIQLLVKRSHQGPQMPLSSLGRQDTALELRPQQGPEAELGNPSDAWHRYATDFTD